MLVIDLTVHSYIFESQDTLRLETLQQRSLAKRLLETFQKYFRGTTQTVKIIFINIFMKEKVEQTKKQQLLLSEVTIQILFKKVDQNFPRKIFAAEVFLGNLHLKTCSFTKSLFHRRYFIRNFLKIPEQLFAG